jgi:hypothetical protein
VFEKENKNDLLHLSIAGIPKSSEKMVKTMKKARECYFLIEGVLYLFLLVYLGRI